MTPRYPHIPGHRGIDTSIAAAKVVAAHRATHLLQVLRVIEAAGQTGATGSEIAGALCWIVYKVRPRLADARAKKLIIDSGERRPSQSRRSEIVWKLPEYEGVETLPPVDETYHWVEGWNADRIAAL